MAKYPQRYKYHHTDVIIYIMLLYMILFKPISSIPEVVFQSGFVSALSQTAGMHRLEVKMADSNYPLLPTWATDCTNLHANGHV